MRIYWFICVLMVTVCACSSKKVPDGFVYPLGGLFFDTEKIEWNEVYFGEAYKDTVRVYNSTDRTIKLGMNNFSSEIQLQQSGEIPQKWTFGGIEIPAGTCDTLIVTICVKDEALLGNYYNVLRFIVDEEVDYSFGIIMEANVVENFGNWNAAEKSEIPCIEIESKEMDFGKIKEGEKVSLFFKMKNTGGSNLLIRKIETTCGCTAVVPGKRVIEPGKTVEMEVVFHSDGRSGMQRKVITLYCNDPRQPVVKLIVEGEVV